MSSITDNLANSITSTITSNLASNITNKKKQIGLTLGLSLLFFSLLLVSILLAGLIVFILMWTGVISSINETFSVASNAVLLVVVISLVIGSIVAILVSHTSLRPVSTLIFQMNRLASGDFRARLHYRFPFDRIPAFKDVTNSFNTMATELENTEMLRSDFVNTFSHEFKTPIVSIAGFTKLLRRDDLTEAQRLEYLGVIEEESLRLSDMATNMLNLSRVERQEMLTDVTEFNLSEQLRSCVLLLEQKWERRQLGFSLEFDEHDISASEELLMQVWINLLDNAIKFAGEGSTIELAIAEEPASDKSAWLAVRVSNVGAALSPQQSELVFNKFYQADASRATQGNGIGLAIVKRIVELHHGSVQVESGEGVTSFTVFLPKRQR